MRRREPSNGKPHPSVDSTLPVEMAGDWPEQPPPEKPRLGATWKALLLIGAIAGAGGGGALYLTSFARAEDVGSQIGAVRSRVERVEQSAAANFEAHAAILRQLDRIEARLDRALKE